MSNSKLIAAKEALAIFLELHGDIPLDDYIECGLKAEEERLRYEVILADASDILVGEDMLLDD